MNKLTIIIPTYNEEAGITSMVESLSESLRAAHVSADILIIDDSTDKTPDIVSALTIPSLRFIHRTTGRGVGSAIVRGIREAATPYAIIMMGDAPKDVRYVPAILGKLEEGCDIVHASRFLGGSVVGYPPLKMLGNRLCNIAAGLLSGHPGIKDFTHLFKGVRVAAVRSLKLESNSFDIGVELSLKGLKAGLRIGEVPVDWYERDVGASSFHLRRLAWRYFTRTLKCI